MDLNEAINDLEDFLIADLPSKVFPMMRIKDQTMFREDYFFSTKDVVQYIEDHFKVFRKQLKKLEQNKPFTQDLNRSQRKKKKVV